MSFNTNKRGLGEHLASLKETALEVNVGRKGGRYIES